jgi:hypothetical protein
MPAGFCTRRWTLTGIVGLGAAIRRRPGRQSPRTIRSPRTLRQVTEWIRRPLSLVPEDSSVKTVALHRFVSTLLASCRFSRSNRQQIPRATNRGLPKAKATAPIIRLHAGQSRLVISHGCSRSAISTGRRASSAADRSQSRRERTPTSAALLLGTAQTHAQPAAIFIDEFHPCGLEQAADGLIIDPGELGRAGGELGTADGGDAHCGLFGELFGAPSDEGASGPDLGAGQPLHVTHHRLTSRIIER